MTYPSSARSSSDLPQARSARTSSAPALHRAIRRHRRALRALQGISFDGISSDTTRQLRHRLQRELADLQRQLQHPPSDAARSAQA
ncbi:MAG: hypothetical protein GVY12_14530 [Bacteroidetes bacterium]|jgi:uncharacterized membrane-anchored protein YjiN (DUF445 family)|nr:hypothetical protein [Bacteroidota bacterium]